MNSNVLNRKGIEVLIKGAVSYTPLFRKYTCRGTSTISARYCYTVWLRHVTLAFRNNILKAPPGVLAELGPGNSLGVGIAALLSGVEKYYALDVKKYSKTAVNLRIMQEIVDLFRKNEDIPGDDEFPGLNPQLVAYGFPYDIIQKESLNKYVKEERIKAIRAAVEDAGENIDGIEINYFAPWGNELIMKEKSVGMIIANAVMEHVDNLEETYRNLYKWLKPGGLLSNAIDFNSHGMSNEWNGHWAYSDISWRVIRGGRPYLLNRQPLSYHINCMEEAGFEIAALQTSRNLNGLKREKLSKRYQGLSDDDITTSTAFVQGVK